MSWSLLICNIATTLTKAGESALPPRFQPVTVSVSERTASGR